MSYLAASAFSSSSYAVVGRAGWSRQSMQFGSSWSGQWMQSGSQLVGLVHRQGKELELSFAGSRWPLCWRRGRPNLGPGSFKAEVPDLPDLWPVESLRWQSEELDSCWPSPQRWLCPPGGCPRLQASEELDSCWAWPQRWLYCFRASRRLQRNEGLRPLELNEGLRRLELNVGLDLLCCLRTWERLQPGRFAIGAASSRGISPRRFWRRA